MDSAQWTQEFGVTKSMPEIAAAISMGACTTTRPTLMEKKIMRPPKDLALNCPRCQSTNTKFCYYNNYSLTQPRYFCKTCRRYWTEGGTLRNVPVGGGSRKHKKSISSAHNNSNNSPNSLSMAMDQLPILSPRLALPDLNPPSIAHFSSRNPKIHDQGQDLNLGFQAHDHPQEYHHQHHGLSQFLEFPKIEGKDVISSSSSSSSPLLALNFLRNGNIGAGGLNSFIPNMVPNSDLDQSNGLFSSSAGFPFQECKPSLAFSIDGNINSGSGYANPNAPEENIDGALMFTLGATKRHSSTSDQGDDIQDKGSNENCNGFWNGMLGGGSW